MHTVVYCAPCICTILTLYWRYAVGVVYVLCVISLSLPPLVLSLCMCGAGCMFELLVAAAFLHDSHRAVGLFNIMGQRLL